MINERQKKILFDIIVEVFMVYFLLWIWNMNPNKLQINIK